MKYSPLTICCIFTVTLALVGVGLSLAAGLALQWAPSFLHPPAIPHITSSDYAPLVGLFLMFAVTAGGWLASSLSTRD